MCGRNDGETRKRKDKMEEKIDPMWGGRTSEWLETEFQYEYTDTDNFHENRVGKVHGVEIPGRGGHYKPYNVQDCRSRGSGSLAVNIGQKVRMFGCHLQE